jgi:hypothetical protein
MNEANATLPAATQTLSSEAVPSATPSWWTSLDSCGAAAEDLCVYVASFGYAYAYFYFYGYSTSSSGR